MSEPSNFDFLRDVWPLVYRNAVEAELFARRNPSAAPNRARAAFEAAHLRYRGLSVETSYEERPSLASFVGQLRRDLGENDRTYQAAEALYEVANVGSHLKADLTTEEEAVRAIEDLFLVLRRLFVTRGFSSRAHIPEFEPALVPSASLQRQRENLADGTHTVPSLAALCVGREPLAQAAAAAAVMEALAIRFASFAERHTF